MAGHAGLHRHVYRTGVGPALRLVQCPLPLTILGDALVALGLLFVFFVFRENTYTSGIIEVEAEQKLISTGPYAIVRHPMYIGSLIMLLGVPLALELLVGFDRADPDHAGDCGTVAGSGEVFGAELARIPGI